MDSKLKKYLLLRMILIKMWYYHIMGQKDDNVVFSR